MNKVAKVKVEDNLKGERKVYLEEAGFKEINIYDRMDLPIGAEIRGPAIIEQEDSTTYLPEKTVGKIGKYKNMIVDVPLDLSLFPVVFGIPRGRGGNPILGHCHYWGDHGLCDRDNGYCGSRTKTSAGV